MTAVAATTAMASGVSAFVAPTAAPTSASMAARAAGARSSGASALRLTPDGGRAFAVAGRSQRRTMRMGISVDFMEYVIGNQDGESSVTAPVKNEPGFTPGQAPERFEITAAQRETLLRDGVVHIPQVLTPDWLSYLRDHTEWQIENPHIWASPGVASGLYDYIQRNVWTTNWGFYEFLAYGPCASVFAQLGGALKGQSEADEVRLTTDLLMVNPNKGFKWHQDNQNGPVAFEDALRWWVTLDDTPADHGAPVYLQGSQNNTSVGEDAVFVNLADGDLPNYPQLLEFRPKAGDMIVWHPKSIHKIDGPESQDWEKRKRRVLGGTVALNDALFWNKEKVEFADMGRHDLEHGDPLSNPHFPRIWPAVDPVEFQARQAGEVGRSFPGFLRMWSALFSKKTRDQFGSFTKVYNTEKPPEVVEADEAAEAATSASR